MIGRYDPYVTSDSERPGSFPYTRGIRADGYRARPWTMRQYAGFSSAVETNARFRQLLDRGQTGLSVGVRPADADRARLGRSAGAGEVGKIGVAIDSLADMERCSPRSRSTRSRSR